MRFTIVGTFNTLPDYGAFIVPCTGATHGPVQRGDGFELRVDVDLPEDCRPREVFVAAARNRLARLMWQSLRPRDINVLAVYHDWPERPFGEDRDLAVAAVDGELGKDYF